jgi:hypothetical protein
MYQKGTGQAIGIVRAWACGYPGDRRLRPAASEGSSNRNGASKDAPSFG